MKLETIKRRITKNRPTMAVTLQMPTDVVEDLKKMAQQKEFSDYRGLLRAYIGAGLREDLERLEQQR